MALKKTGFGVLSGCEPVAWINHSRGSKLRPFGFIYALMNTVPSVNEPLLQLVNAVFRFCVMSGSVVK